MHYGNKLYGKWFEPRGINYLFSVIVQVRVVFGKTVVTNNSLSKYYPHLDDHAKQINKLYVVQLLLLLL